MTEYAKTSPEALSIALLAVLYEAKKLGVDIDKVCAAALQGMPDGGKLSRGGSALWVAPASEAIKGALADAKSCA